MQRCPDALQSQLGCGYVEPGISEAVDRRANVSGDSSTRSILQLGDGTMEEIDTTITRAAQEGKLVRLRAVIG